MTLIYMKPAIEAECGVCGDYVRRGEAWPYSESSGPDSVALMQPAEGDGCFDLMDQHTKYMLPVSDGFGISYISWLEDYVTGNYGIAIAVDTVNGFVEAFAGYDVYINDVLVDDFFTNTGTDVYWKETPYVNGYEIEVRLRKTAGYTGFIENWEVSASSTANIAVDIKFKTGATTIEHFKIDAVFTGWTYPEVTPDSATLTYYTGSTFLVGDLWSEIELIDLR